MMAADQALPQEPMLFDDGAEVEQLQRHPHCGVGVWISEFIWVAATVTGAIRRLFMPTGR